MNSWPVRIDFITKRVIKQIFCRHKWQTDLIFSGGRNTHNEIKSCMKCPKSVRLFSGTRKEWMLYHDQM